MGGILVIFLGLFAVLAVLVFAAVVLLAIPYGIYEESHRTK